MTHLTTPSPPHNVPSTRRRPARLTARRCGWRVWTCAAGLVVCGIAVWESGLKYSFLPKRFDVVVPGKVYRSGQISKYVIDDVIDCYQIQAIVDLNGFNTRDEDQQAELATARARGVPTFRFPLRGNGTGDIRHYAAALTEVDRGVKSGRAVLIHCQGGSSRTGAAIGFYRLLVQNREPDDVMQEMSRFKDDLSATHPMIVYMNRHMQRLAELLVDSGVLPHMPETIPQFE